jgi:hypothetical protein
LTRSPGCLRPGGTDGRADALEECLRLAQDAQLARETLADLRATLDRAEARARALEAALPQAKRRFCRCGQAAPCGLHALVRRAQAVAEPEWTKELYREFRPTTPRPIRLTLIPYYAWGNRGRSEMTVWLPLGR